MISLFATCRSCGRYSMEWTPLRFPPFEEPICFDCTLTYEGAYWMRLSQ